MSQDRISPELDPRGFPLHWKFHEKEAVGFTPTLIDVDERFLAARLPDRPASTVMPYYKGEYIDRFFDSLGNPTDSRIHGAFDTKITIFQDFPMVFHIHEWAGAAEHMSLQVEILERLKSQREVGAFPPRIARVDYTTSVGSPIGALESIVLGCPLKEEDQEGHVMPLFTSLHKKYLDPAEPYQGLQQASGLETQDWELLDLVGTNGYTSYRVADNRYGFFNAQGNLIWGLEWRVTDGVLYVSKTYLPQIPDVRVTQIFEAKVRLPLTDIAQVLFAPVYRDEDRKKEKGQIVAPWRNIDELMGVHAHERRQIPKGTLAGIFGESQLSKEEFERT